jgi:hypothetical protein
MTNCGIFISHLGLGDMLMLMPAITECALQCDLLYVFCKDIYLDTINDFIKYKNNIKLLIINSQEDINVELNKTIQHLFDTTDYNFTMFTSGGYNENTHPIIDFPTCFYKDLSLDYTTVCQKYSAPITERAHKLYRILEENKLDNNYIFLHTISSNHKIDLDLDLSSNHIIINPEENMYPPDHCFYTIAQQFIRTANNISMIDYKLIIEGANEIHMIDSSYFCFATLLKLRASSKTIFSRHNNEYTTIIKNGWNQLYITNFS